MEEVVANDDCACYVDTAGLVKDESRREPISCLQNCKDQFLRTLSPDWSEPSGWVNVCGNLTSNEPTRRLWPLYWCDSSFCGVWINQTGGVWQDPTVNLIINTCQNYGFHSVLDPGPPPATFACQTGSNGNEQATCTSWLQASVSTQPTSRIEQESSTTSTSSSPHTTATTTGQTATSTETPTPVLASSTTPAKATTLVATQGSLTSGNSLSAGTKIAIAICSTIVLVALIFLAFLCLRRRQRVKQAFHNHLRLAECIPSGGGSSTPLISPANSATGGSSSRHHQQPVLSPPLRLRDRRILLPSILRSGTNRSPSPPLTPLTPAYSSPSLKPTHYSSNNNAATASGFPSSPICSPATNKLVPRHERVPPTPRNYTAAAAGGGGLNAGLPPIPPQIAFAAPSSRGSLGSYNGSGGSPSATTTFHSSLRTEFPFLSGPRTQHQQQQQHNTPPKSPPRPPRPHDTPLEIPDLVSPASPPLSSASPLGPPPTRALPPPPPPTSPTSAGGGNGTNSPGGMRSPPPPPPPPSSRGVALPKNPHDFVDIVAAAAAAAKENPRGSWGSWNGMTGDGGSGTDAVVLSPVRSRAVAVINNTKGREGQIEAVQLQQQQRGTGATNSATVSTLYEEEEDEDDKRHTAAAAAAAADGMRGAF
ncbi:hypothetical protein B0T17DRAFT_9914 [Bombardia bombarda]|uniref:Uncharacterized protein n=1 Tax=Bombardia bombarda TaxID=252184 RepID=A0AA39XIE7_9PEZI|nr:hypothetical protein B0T17DRAFT_9914 [Bombardia bombarda]